MDETDGGRGERVASWDFPTELEEYEGDLSLHVPVDEPDEKNIPKMLLEMKSSPTGDRHWSVTLKQIIVDKTPKGDSKR